MKLPTLVTGDDFALPVNLKVDGVPWAVSASFPVKAGVVSSNHAELWLPGVVQVSTTQGADWESGLVVVLFSKVDTAQILKSGLAFIELQVSGATENSWFIPINVIRGLVT